MTVMIISIIGRPGDNGKNSGLENLQREIAILKKVDHPYVVRLFEVCMTKRGTVNDLINALSLMNAF